MMEDQIINIMDSVFECTLDMINKDFSEYPEHRVEFFKLLRTINLRCFPALLRLDARSFKFVIDSCMWASKHDNREVESAGLSMCFELVSKMFWLVDSDKLQGPIYTSPDMAPAGTPNREFLRNFVGNLLATAFPNLQT